MNPAMRILHGALAMGLLLAGAIFIFLLRGGAWHPLIATRSIGFLFAGLSLAILLGALVGLRPRMTQRRSDESPDMYWAVPTNRAAAVILWAIVDGAAFLGLVGYLLTGALAPAASAVLALTGLLLVRPSRLQE